MSQPSIPIEQNEPSRPNALEPGVAGFNVDRVKNMKLLRWIAAIPIAFAVSLAVWVVLSSIFRTAHGGPDLIARISGYAPIVIRASLPTALFVVSAVLVCPSTGRKAPFAFFSAALLCSAGETEMVQFYPLGVPSFWLTAAVGVVAGALVGLFISLACQDRRKQNAESTPSASAPPAANHP